jgi:hypothetical protein
MAIKINWDKYKRWAFEYALSIGGNFMWKNLWNWLVKSAKARAKELIVSQEDELAALIKQYADPDLLAHKLVEWICERIDKA